MISTMPSGWRSIRCRGVRDRALTVRDIFGVDDPIALAAALLHDLIEDTAADYDAIKEEFGGKIADVVAALTKDRRMIDAAREAAYDQQLAQAPWQARLVKLADVYDNISDSVDDKMRAKAIQKAVRALRIAGNEPQVKVATREVQLLIGSRKS